MLRDRSASIRFTLEQHDHNDHGPVGGYECRDSGKERTEKTKGFKHGS